MVDSESDFKYLRSTKLLTSEEDIASKLVAGVDDFLLRKSTESVGSRSRYWKRDVSSITAFAESVQPNREVFVWPHAIHGEGTFEFLHRHLDWPLPKERS